MMKGRVRSQINKTGRSSLLTSQTKKEDNDNKQIGLEGRSMKDISKIFPNFGALTEVERVAFFEALTEARKNVENRGNFAGERFGTIHDEYLEYLKEASQNEFFSREEKQKKTELAHIKRSVSNTTFLKDEGSFEGDSFENLMNNTSFDDFFLLDNFSQSVASISSSEVTNRKSGSNPESFCLPHLDVSDPYHEMIWQECESVLKRERDKVISLFLNKKKRLDMFDSVDGLQSSAPSLKSTCAKMIRCESQADLLNPFNKANMETREIKTIEQMEVEKGLVLSDIIDSPNFDALNSEEKDAFWSVLREARESIILENSNKNNTIVSLGNIMKDYDVKEKVFPVCSASSNIQKKKSPRGGQRNVKVKIRLSSADNKRINNEKKVEKAKEQKKSKGRTSYENEEKTEEKYVEKLLSHTQTETKKQNKSQEKKNDIVLDVKKESRQKVHFQDSSILKTKSVEESKQKKKILRPEESKEESIPSRKNNIVKNEDGKKDKKVEVKSKQRNKQEKVKSKENLKEDEKSAKKGKSKASISLKKKENEGKVTSKPAEKQSLPNDQLHIDMGLENVTEMMISPKEELIITMTKELNNEQAVRAEGRKQQMKENVAPIRKDVAKAELTVIERRTENAGENMEEKEFQYAVETKLPSVYIGRVTEKQSEVEAEIGENLSEEEYEQFEMRTKLEERADSQEEGEEYKSEESIIDPELSTTKESFQKEESSDLKPQMTSNNSLIIAAEERFVEAEERCPKVFEEGGKYESEIKKNLEVTPCTAEEKGMKETTNMKKRSMEIKPQMTSLTDELETQAVKEEDKEDKHKRVTVTTNSIIKKKCVKQEKFLQKKLLEGKPTKKQLLNKAKEETPAIKENITCEEKLKEMKIKSVEEQKSKGKVCEPVVPEFKSGKVILIDDDVIDKIKKLIRDLETKAKPENNDLENEYLQLLVGYTEYLTKVLESLTSKKNKRRDHHNFKVQTSLTATGFHLMFDDKNLKTVLVSPEEKRMQDFSWSTNDADLNDRLNKKCDVTKYSRKAKVKEDSDESSYPVISVSESGSDYSDKEIVYSTPMLIGKNRAPNTKIRLLQDLIKERVEFVEGSASDLKIKYLQEKGHEASEKAKVEFFSEEKDEEDTEEETCKSNFLRVLMQFCRCWQKGVKERKRYVRKGHGVRGACVRFAEE